MNLQRTTLLLALAAATVLTCSAQNADPAAAPAPPQNYPTQAQPAPIQRSAPDAQDAPPNYAPNYGPPQRGYGRRAPQQPTMHISTTNPTPGIFLRAPQNASFQTVSAAPGHSEFRVDHGRINISVHHPAKNSLIQVDLPGGQTNILKDGLYTFNADTNTVAVLKGEALAFRGAGAKPIKIKEDHVLIFNGPDARSIDVGPFQAMTDVLPRNDNGEGIQGPGAYGPRAYAPYGDGPYAYPYYAYGYPYGYYGYPFGIGLGFGYYGGFGGGFRGGFRR